MQLSTGTELGNSENGGSLTSWPVDRLNSEQRSTAIPTIVPKSVAKVRAKIKCRTFYTIVHNFNVRQIEIKNFSLER